MAEMEFEVRDKQIEDLLRKIGDIIRGVMPKSWGFSLMIFRLGEPGGMFYTSNANRKDMIKAMQEFIAKFREN